MAVLRALRDACGGSNNTFTAGNGTTRGDAGNTRGAGRPAPCAGTWPRRAACGEDQATGLPTRRGRARPLHLIHGGPCLIQHGKNILPGPPPRQPPECRPRVIWLRPSRARFPGPPRRAGDDKRESRRAGNRPVQDRRSASPQDWMPRRREQRRLRGAALRHRPLPTGNQLLNPVVDGDRRLPLWLVAVVAPVL